MTVASDSLIQDYIIKKCKKYSSLLILLYISDYSSWENFHQSMHEHNGRHAREKASCEPTWAIRKYACLHLHVLALTRLPVMLRRRMWARARARTGSVLARDRTCRPRAPQTPGAVHSRDKEDEWEWVSEWVSEWMSEWVNEWVSEWVERVREWM